MVNIDLRILDQLQTADSADLWGDGAIEIKTEEAVVLAGCTAHCTITMLYCINCSKKEAWFAVSLETRCAHTVHLSNQLFVKLSIILTLRKPVSLLSYGGWLALLYYWLASFCHSCNIIQTIIKSSRSGKISLQVGILCPERYQEFLTTMKLPQGKNNYLNVNKPVATWLQNHHHWQLNTWQRIDSANLKSAIQCFYLVSLVNEPVAVRLQR